MKDIETFIDDTVNKFPGESDNPEYLEWKEREIRKSIEFGQKNPDSYTPLGNVIAQFDVKYEKDIAR